MATKVKSQKKKSSAGELSFVSLDGSPSLDPEKITTVDNFLKTGESNTCLGQHPCVCEKEFGPIYIIRKNGVLVQYGEFDGPPQWEFSLYTWKSAEPLAVLVNSSHSKRKFDLILNGDESDLDGLDIHLEDESAAITVSFDIFIELLAPPKGKRIPLNKILGWLNDGTIKILNSRPDEYKKLTPAAQRKISGVEEKQNRRPDLSEAQKLIRPPEAGFTLVLRGSSAAGCEWHRAATVLFRHRKVVYLIGQDEGTYFGCQLVDQPETIDEAYRSLMPEKIRKITGLQRQGEWFIIPVSASKVPKPEQCVATFDDGRLGIILPRDDKESNSHVVLATDGRITSDGVFVKGGSIEHEDHTTIVLGNQWMTFVKNTAVRSVSQEGVD